MNYIATQPAARTASRIGPRLMWPLLLGCLLLSLAFIVIPVFLIQPFRPQTQRGLEISYALRSWSPLATVALMFGSVALAIWQWRNTRRWWRKALLILLLLLSIGPVWFARQNHLEWMFNPLQQSAYTRAAEAGFVRDPDMVLAVKINNEAVAYPVRLMAYHHLVQDTVGGTPICATY